MNWLNLVANNTPNNPGAKAVTIISGGMDSVVLAHLLAYLGYFQHLISFNYGQKHVKELHYARLTAERLNVKHSVIDLTSVAKVLGASSSLINDFVPVPEVHYTSEVTRLTTVPARNIWLLSIALAAAVADEAEVLAYGAHLSDAMAGGAAYPDCTQEFMRKFEIMMKEGTAGFSHPNLKLLTPFASLTKADVVRIGLELDVPFELTQSCYNGMRPPCGKCPTCQERTEAFEELGLVDPLLSVTA